MKYEAFISYRHGDIDEDVAVRVQKEIEKYKVPKKIATRIGKKHVGKAFRDSDELHASSDLSAIIQEALDESEWLIAICSPRYLESEWCHQEIEYFVNLRGQEKVIVILVDGEPRETFPRELTEKEVNGQIVEIEPLAVDIRGESRKDILKNLGHERFRFLSSILGVDYDDLRNRQRERRIRRIVAATASAFVILAGVIGAITVKNIELNRAYEDLDQSNEKLARSFDELEQANQETLRGESYYLAEYADQAYREGDRETAIKLALSALPKDLDNPDRPYVPDAVRALTNVTEIYDYTAGYHVGFSSTAEYEVFDAYSRFSEDGSLVLIERFREAEGGVSYYRTVEVYRVTDGKKLCEYREADTYYTDFSIQSMAAVFSEDGKKLYYLSEKGLTCVGIDDGKEYFTAEKADDMRVNLSAGPGQTAIVTIDHKKDRIYGYDLSGEKTLSLKIGESKLHDMGVIDPESGRLPIIDTRGILVINVYTGEKKYCLRTGGLASPVAFVDEDCLVYRAPSPSVDSYYIESYNVKTGERKKLSKPGQVISPDMMTITDKETVYYYQGSTFYELGVRYGRKKKLWEYELPVEIESVTAGDGLVAIGCKDGSMYVFEEEGKRQIPTPAGNGKAVCMRSVSKNAYATSDYRGRTLRIYRTQESEFHSASRKVSIADITDGEVPFAWNTADTNCGRFLFSVFFFPQRALVEFDSTTMERIGIRNITDYGDNCVYKQGDDEYVNYCSYDTNTLYHFDPTLTKEIYKSENMEQNYYFYREDGKILYESLDQKMRIIEAATGKVLEEENIPNGFLYEVKLGDRLLLGSGDEIRIEGGDGNTETTLEDAVLEEINEERGLVFYLNKNADTWNIYDVNKQQIVLEEKVVGSYEKMQFFGDNRYVFKDYTEIYDMDTWEKVLTLKLENGEPYGAYTTKDCPFFVVWTRSTEDNRDNVESAVLYEKGGNGDPVGVINNFVALTPDNQIVVYDGEQTLYKFPLLTVEEIIKKAEQMVGNTELTEDQKEKYHLFR